MISQPLHPGPAPPSLARPSRPSVPSTRADSLRRPPFPGSSPGRRSPLPRALAAALLLAALLAAPLVAPPAGAQGGEDDVRPRMQGLPPAPPPSGIRPARPRDEVASRRGPGTRRAATEALGVPLTIEVHGTPRESADDALRAAVAAVRALEPLLDPAGDPEGGGLAALNAAAGRDPVVVDRDLVEVLERALSYCRWSDRAHGPLGAELYRLWGLRDPAPARPTEGQLEDASRAAACDHVAMERAGVSAGGGGEDSSPPRAQLAPGARLDLWGFARGFAVDRALETLREQGVENGFVELGGVRRAIGPGPDGKGWPVVLPVFPGQPRPLDRIWLRDEALAVSSAVHRPLLVGGDRHAPFVDQRSGRPAEGVVGVVVVTDLAVDAEALAASLMILGSREGLLRMGGLKPRPHVLWLLGGGDSAPVLSQFNWTEVALR